MPDWKGTVKNGWRPGKEGGSLRGQVSGLLGRGGNNDQESPHIAAPISSLRDPNSFGPPPKRDPRAPAPYPPSGQNGVVEHAAEPTGDEPPAAPKPWQLDSTGLSTSHLPPPPGRKDGADGRTPGVASPPPPPRATGSPAAAAKPSLPPRLPPRAGTGSPSPTSTSVPSRLSAPAQQSQPAAGLLNQASVSRLGSAGISVPGLGIGPKPATATSSPTAPQASQGTTFAQKQAALRTAAQLHKDPGSVSLADARSAASTANSFRERHGAQVASGLQAGGRLGQEFGVKNAFSGGASAVSPAPPANTNGGGNGAGGVGQLAGQLGGIATAVAAKKKPAPPPPRKKPELSAAGASSPTGMGNGAPPPPVPLATRPKF